MTISIWRYSHLALAVSSFLFITLAAVTGIILAFEPVTEKVPSYRVHNFNQLTLADALPALKKVYPDITDASVDANQYFTVKGNDADGKKLLAYVDPRTGQILGHPGKPNEFFQWVTGLHRSLFLHEPGRIFVGITAFLLALIALSGMVLVIRRQRGVKHFFKKIVKESFAQYYHVVLGRLSLIPILIIALSGTYLSLAKFKLLAQVKVKHQVNLDAIKSIPKKKLAEFTIFKQTRLSQVQAIEFPFSDDVEDYFTLKLSDREITVNQLTGDVLTTTPYPTTVLLNNLSLDLHTGRTSAIWAIVLAIASINILFFIYSGFVITLKRRANRVKNKYTANESRYIILVGSENGSTFKFAGAVQQQLIANGKKVFLAELNHYTSYPNAEHILIFTATYGLGDAPTNSNQFKKLVEKHPQAKPVQFSVIAFGSHAYPDFCRFGFEVNNLLSQQSWATPFLEIYTVNDKSFDEFNQWVTTWSQKATIPLQITSNLFNAKPVRLSSMSVTEKSPIAHEDGAFLILLKPSGKIKFTSGDLLAIYPAADHRERLYSIGKIGDNIQLSVKLHIGGLGSNYLYNLNVGDSIQARVERNLHFYLPKKSASVIMVSNGTGIAPFLGMLAQNENKIETHLYCGFRGESSFKLYDETLTNYLKNQQLKTLNIAYSREGEKHYVKDLLLRDELLITNALKKGGAVMLCGSLAMQNDVIDLLDTICTSQTGKGISHYQSHGQILMDCY